jgi:hypothetical protein
MNLRFKWLFLRKVITWNSDKKVIIQSFTEKTQRITEELISEFTFFSLYNSVTL